MIHSATTVNQSLDSWQFDIRRATAAPLSVLINNDTGKVDLGHSRSEHISTSYGSVKARSCVARNEMSPKYENSKLSGISQVK